MRLGNTQTHTHNKNLETTFKTNLNTGVDIESLEEEGRRWLSQSECTDGLILWLKMTRHQIIPISPSNSISSSFLTENSSFIQKKCQNRLLNKTIRGFYLVNNWQPQKQQLRGHQSTNLCDGVPLSSQPNVSLFFYSTLHETTNCQ